MVQTSLVIESYSHWTVKAGKDLKNHQVQQLTQLCHCPMSLSSKSTHFFSHSRNLMTHRITRKMFSVENKQITLPSLQAFKARWDGALRNMVSWKVSCPWQEGGFGWFLKSLSTQAILTPWFCIVQQVSKMQEQIYCSFLTDTCITFAKVLQRSLSPAEKNAE